jgi:DNA-binding NtrC family response regulator
MSTESPAILFVDDDPDVQKAARLVAARHGMAMTAAANPDAAWARLAERSFDAVMLDLNFSRGRTSGEEGFAMLSRLIAADRDAVVIVVTGHSGINVAVEAMRAGASDFVIKPWSNDKLAAALERAVTLRRARRQTAVPAVTDDDRLILGEDAAVAAVRQVIAKIALTDAAVLITGPAGSGKSLVARAIHHASSRAAVPLVTVSARATTDHAGLVRAIEPARGGTLLIDDLDALAPALQPILAAALDDVRPIATSRRDLAGLRAIVDADLLARVDTVEITLPPLARRGDDAIRLGRHFIELFSARHGRAAPDLDDAATARIAGHGWPDNVRELRRTIERAVLLADGGTIGVGDLAIGEPQPNAMPGGDFNLARSERALVEAALKRHAFNVSRAAADLGLTRTALYRRMAKYGL